MDRCGRRASAGALSLMRALVRELFETVILALLIFLALQISIENFRVEGSSMLPTLEEGEYVVVNKLVYMRFQLQDVARLVPFWDVDEDRDLFPFHEPRRGEVVIFRFPRDESRDFVKRVIGVGPAIVEIKRGQVFVNDEALDEPYIVRPSSRSMAPKEVPEGAYFVLGDNRAASNDSRDWGPVPAGNIIGKAWVSFWPLDSLRALLAFP